MILEEAALLVFRNEGKDKLTHLGTAFRAHRPGLAVTAAHVVQGESALLVMGWHLGALTPVTDVHFSDEKYGRAPLGRVDLAVLELDGEPDGENVLNIAQEVNWNLGDQIYSYGYPQHWYPAKGQDEITPRLMVGHLQRFFTHEGTIGDVKWSYPAFEVGFPAFPCQSGSPVMLSAHPRHAIGMVTSSIEYSTEQGSEKSSASWAIALALPRFANLWIRHL